jgi:hypothetical protein
MKSNLAIVSVIPAFRSLVVRRAKKLKQFLSTDADESIMGS